MNILPPNDIFLTDKEILFYFKKLNFVTISDLNHEKNFDFQSKRISLPFFDNIEQSKISKILDFIIKSYNEEKTIIFCSENKEKLYNYKRHFENVLKEKNIFGNYNSYYDLLNSNRLDKLIYCDFQISYSFIFLNYVFISENDFIKNDFKKKKSNITKTENFLKDLNSLKIKDYVAHIDHGVGVYKSLEIINIAGHDHDCLKIEYHGGDKLFVPVENINLLSKIGENNETRVLDKLGSSQWLLKRSKIKNKIDDIAQKLINTAANRKIQSKQFINKPQNYIEFIENFPFELTEDQDNAINDVLNDLYSNKLMDRLILVMLVLVKQKLR